MDKISVKDILEVTKGSLYYGDEAKLSESYVTGVTSDSRNVTDKSLFLCINGEKTNGHNYIGSACKGGASCILISENVDTQGLPDDIYLIRTEDSLAAVQMLAGWYRRRYDVPVIGVTGSVGKTTTKEMIACALSAEKRVLKTRGNLNSQLGVSLMMFELTEDIEAAVIEMGISEAGEMDKLTKIAAPETAVVTNIGVSHIANLGSRENICKEKLSITRGFSEKGGELYICGNDDMLRNIDEHSDMVSNALRVVKFGSTDNCSAKAENIRFNNETVSFTAVINGRSIAVTLNVPGIHNVHNALAALLCADRYGVDLYAAAKSLEGYRSLAMRGASFEYNGAVIIDDTYNASPDSIKSALSVLLDRKCTGKRYAVLADVLELGDMSDELHTQIGQYIAQMNEQGRKTDILITFGEKAEFIANEVMKQGITETISFAERRDIIEYLRRNLKCGDVCVIKGSRGMKMDEVASGLR